MDISQLTNLPYYILSAVFILWGLGTLLISMSIVRNRTNIGLVRGVQTIREDGLSEPEVSGDTFIVSVRKTINRLFSFINSEETKKKLIQADWKISVTEYFLIQYSVLILGFLFFWMVTGQIISGIGFALIVFFFPGIILNQNVRKRQRKFQDQLLDALTLLTGAVRVGFSFLQSLDVAIQELADPASREFAEVKREMELGVPLSEALIGLSERMGSDDLFLVVTAININAQVGGNLTTILEAIINTISERIRLLGEIRVLSSYARYSSYLLSALPFITAGLIFIFNPDYISQLLLPGIGQIILGAALLAILLGNIWIRRIANFEI